MDFAAIAKAAMELGVIPTVALFLVVAMHAQNRKLTAMLEKKDQHSNEILTILITYMTAADKPASPEGRRP